MMYGSDSKKVNLEEWKEELENKKDFETLQIGCGLIKTRAIFVRENSPYQWIYISYQRDKAKVIINILLLKIRYPSQLHKDRDNISVWEKPEISYDKFSKMTK